MSKDLQPSANEILQERLNDILLGRLSSAEKIKSVERLVLINRIAVRAVVDAGLAGNVRCRQALQEIIPLLPNE